MIWDRDNWRLDLSLNNDDIPYRLREFNRDVGPLRSRSFGIIVPKQYMTRARRAGWPLTGSIAPKNEMRVFLADNSCIERVVDGTELVLDLEADGHALDSLDAVEFDWVDLVLIATDKREHPYRVLTPYVEAMRFRLKK
jgi:hypothetical protein